MGKIAIYREIGRISRHYTRIFYVVALLVTVFTGRLWAGDTVRDAKLDLKVENKTLVEVMDLLKSQTGVSFIYNARDVESVTNITIDVKEKSVAEIMDIVLKDTELTYLIEGNTLILKQIVRQQRMADEKKQRTVSGVVIGTQNDTLPGVTVRVDRTSVGVVTDVHGRYSIALPDGDNIYLIFSFVGKKTQRVKYTGQTELNITLEDESQNIDEVVVTGYQEIDKRHLTSAIQTIKAEDIMMPGVSSIDKMLEGRVPGMIFMQNSGQVGATPRLRIRGTSTVLGTQEPVWVLDGVVLTDPVNVDPSQINDLDFVNLLGNAISGLNPYDIESINILKDASATALYGTQAANGVIVITTKQGTTGPMRVGYHADVTYQSRPRYNNRIIYMMDSRERIEYSREAIEKGLSYGNNAEGWGGYEALVEQYNRGEISYAEFSRQVSRLESMNTDWLDILMRDVVSHNHTLSFSGGTQNMRYYASVGYNRENGVLKKEFGDRYTASLSLNFTEKKFNAQFRLNANVREQEHTPSDVGLTSYAYQTSRAIPLYEENGDLYYYTRKSEKTNSSYFNIVNERDHSYDNLDGSSVSFSTNMGYRFLPNLKAQVTFSYTVSNTDNETYYGEETYYAANLAGYSGHPLETDFAPSQDHSTEWPFGGELTRNTTKNKNYMLRGQLDWHTYLDEGNVHMLSASAGGELSSSRYTGLNKTFRCYLPDRGMIVNSVDLERYKGYGTWLSTNSAALGTLKDQLSNKVGLYATLTYSYANTYVLNANARIDFSNEFGDLTNDKLLPVWSVSGRWNMKENLVANLWWVDDLALRASFGYQGNIAKEASPELIIRSGGMNNTFGEYYSTIESFPNPDLGWEKTASFNASLDLVLFKEKLKGSVSYYYKKTKNAYLTKKVPTINGVESYTVNEGTVENQGIEFTVNIVPVNTMMSNLTAQGGKRGFRWSIDPQLGTVLNKLIGKLSPGNDFDSLHDDFTYQDYLDGKAYINGKPLNSFLSYEYLGLSPTDGRPTFANIDETMFDQFARMTNAGVFTTVMKYSGCRVPYLQGGVSTTLEYANFILSMNFAYSIGSKIRMLKMYDKISSYTCIPQPSKNVRREFVNRWRKPGDEAHTDVPGLLVTSEYTKTMSPWWKNEPYAFAENIWQMYDESDLRVVSGNYLKLQSLNLRYVFPEELCRKLRVHDLYMSLSGTNLFTWSAKELKGQDPTTQSGSSDNINLSVRPTFSFSLNVTF